VPAGLAALAVAWVVALVLYFALAEVEAPRGSGVTTRDGPVRGVDLGAALVLIGAWQVLFYVVWRGWPFSAIARRSVRLPLAHGVVIAGGILTFVLAHDAASISSARVAAAAGSFVAAGLLLGMLFDGWLRPRFNDRGERIVLLTAVAALTAVLGLGLVAIAAAIDFGRVTRDEWLEHVTLNALAVSTILHVAVGRRWPFAGAADRVEAAA
jgi:hypothetical protein